jgi:hypothetical protein
VGGIGGGGNGQNLSCTLFPFLLENLAGFWFVNFKKTQQRMHVSHPTHNKKVLFETSQGFYNESLCISLGAPLLSFSQFLHLDDEFVTFLLVPTHTVDAVSPIL